ncbi:MAG TPA: phage tail tape measure protein, partial [Chloroflexota bacterium]
MSVTAAELLVKISSETTSAESGIRNVSTLLQTLVGATEGAGAGMATMGTKAEAAAAQAAMLETKASAAAMQAQNLGVRAEQAAVQAEIFANKASMGGVNAEALGVKAQAAAARAQDLGTRAYAAGGQAEYLGTKAAAAGVQAETLAASAEKAGGTLTAFGPAALVAAGGITAVAVGLFKAGEAAAEFQTQLSRAEANTTLTAQQTQAMGTAIVDMSTKSGAGLADLGAGYVHIVNLLGTATDATKVLDVAQQSAISTGGNVAEYSQTLARVLKEFGLGADDAAAAMDTLHTAAAAGDLTLEQFTTNSGNALAQAALYKVPLDQVAAAYVTLTKHGMDAADANTQLADQFLRLTTVTPKVATELERVSKLTGIDLVGDFTTAGLASKGLTGIYADLSAAEQKMGLSSEAANAENMLLGDSLRGGRGLMIDVAYQTNDYLPILSSLDDKTASATKRQDDFNRALETTGGQFAVLKANASAAAVTVGGPVNEAFGGLLGVVNQTIRMAEAWNGTIVAMGEAWVTGAPLGQAWSDQMERIGG